MNSFKKHLLHTGVCAAVVSAALTAHAGFQVSGTQLLDDNGNPFLMRGVNHPHAWFPDRTEQALSDIASVGANTVRIVLSDGQQWTRNSAADVARVIEWSKENELVAVLEVHDATGYGEEDAAGDMAEVVDYWIDLAEVLEGEEDYVIINIANEPFGNDVPASTWVDEHVDAVERLRDAGLTHTLLVDAANWGQDWEGIMRDNASTVAAADELNNTFFSVHMYEVYQDRDTVESYVSDFLDTHGLPLIVGEFGAEHYGNEVDAESVLAVAEEYDIGYLGWSWSGNSSEVDELDITLNWDVDNLSSWGDFLINSDNGLRETAETASVYDGEGGGSSSSDAGSSDSSASSQSSSESSSQSSGDASTSDSASSDGSNATACDWYGTEYPVCDDTDSGWGWENSESCVAASTCASQPDPYGLIDDSASSSSEASESASAPSSSSASSSQAASDGASCTYDIGNEWGSGYTATVRIENEGDSAIEGWSVSWEYDDGTRVDNGWNAALSGSNPYTATDLGWNARIEPGAGAEFGLQVRKGEGEPTAPELSGSVCD